MIHSPCQSLTIVPRHPFRGAGGQFLSMTLQLDQVVEGVGSTQLAGVDQAHEQITDLGAVQSAIKECIGLGSSALRCFNTSARFSPACRLPVK
jgi:hypothetical protein